MEKIRNVSVPKSAENIQLYLIDFMWMIQIKKIYWFLGKQKSIDLSNKLIKYLAGLDISFVKTNNRVVALMAISDHEILNRVIKISANLVLTSSSL